jgi:ankyrin repeat protein
MSFNINANNFEIFLNKSLEQLQVASGRHPQHMEVIKLLIEKGANVNVSNLKGTTPLHNLMRKDANMELISLLTNNKDALNAADKDGNTPLHLAIILYNVEAIKLLIEKGAQLNAVNNDGMSCAWLIKNKNIPIPTRLSLILN